MKIGVCKYCGNQYGPKKQPNGYWKLNKSFCSISCGRASASSLAQSPEALAKRSLSMKKTVIAKAKANEVLYAVRT